MQLRQKKPKIHTLMPKRRTKSRNKSQPFLQSLTSKITRVILERRRMFRKLGRIYLWFLVAPITLLFTIFSLYSVSKPQTTQAFIASTDRLNPLDQSSQVLGTQVTDWRPIRVAKFLKGTPLEKYSTEIVAASDKYEIDYRLIPAIAMKESGAGRVTPKESFNAWGFENGRTRFESWEQAIDMVAKTLKTRYIAKGMDTPDKMMAVYAPPATENGGGWAIAINNYLSQMESSENNL